MAISIDSYLGVHVRALALEARRTELLAANIANADTPNYKARDLDFKAALAGAAGNAATATPLYRVPTAPSLDGNTVDEQLEQAAFAENSVRYQATLTLLSGKLRALLTAITGQ
ncbi:MAG: flagellar basal body rod protein FlgB [Gammaproteobacteria bacterium]|nr:flagellar basal body rod protein FlgB [Gammaproteobacteria bacterium]MDE2250666.1 flagellar basal body rod protein FlgB [Gammaproteobacteria bacterium]